jgi:dethiobiotin synthetase
VRLRGLFVTGTDTGVGKTAVSALLMRRFGGIGLRYWKPIQTGVEQDDDTVEVLRLSGAAPDAVLDDGIRLQHAISPHLAARRAGVRITIAALVERLSRALAPPGGPPGGVPGVPHVVPAWIVEGAGGVLVPINDRENMADVISALALPTLVVARTQVGTINHTLLTVEALRRRQQVVAGIVMVGAPDEDAAQSIEERCGVAVVAQVPLFTPLTPESLGAWAPHCDPGGRLESWLI